MKFRSHLPVDIQFGAGLLKELGQLASAHGKCAFLVTMPEMVLLGLAERAQQSLEQAGIKVVLFDQVSPEPKSGDMESAANAARESKADLVIGLGGGSAIDVAKAVAIGATHPAPIWDYVNLSNRPPKPVDAQATLPVIAIPTTAGTGSEVTPYSVVTNSETVQKGTIKEAAIFPRIALVDPELSSSMPERLTAQTGVDAFAHSLESLLNVANRTPVSDALAWEALSRLIHFLPQAVRNPSDLEARSQVACAATLSGMVIAQAGTTVAHAIAQPLGARLGTTHAESVALFTVPVLRRTLPHDAKRIARLGTLLPGFQPAAGASVEERAGHAVDCLQAFMDGIGIQRRISEIAPEAPDGFTIDYEQLTEFLAEDVTTYMSRPLAQHPVLFDQGDIRAIVQDCL